MTALPGPPGIYRWSGYVGTYFWIDPRNDLIAMVWYQLSPGVGGKVTSRALPFTVTRICLGSNPVYAYHAYGIAEAIDGWGWNTVSALCYDTPNTPLSPSGGSFVVDRPIAPGWQRSNVAASTRLLQKRFNFDARDAFAPNGWVSHFRFRHMNNTRLAALCLDG